MSKKKKKMEEEEEEGAEEEKERKKERKKKSVKSQTLSLWYNIRPPTLATTVGRLSETWYIK